MCSQLNREFSFSFQQRVADCSIQLQFQFHQYNNPAGLKCNRKCCDVIDVFGYCSSACDTAFTRICLGPGGNSEDCPWSDYMLTPGKVGVNSIQFIDKIGDIDNPFTFTVTSQVIDLTFNRFLQYSVIARCIYTQQTCMPSVPCGHGGYRRASMSKNHAFKHSQYQHGRSIYILMVQGLAVLQIRTLWCHIVPLKLCSLCTVVKNASRRRYAKFLMYVAQWPSLSLESQYFLKD